MYRIFWGGGGVDDQNFYYNRFSSQAQATHYKNHSYLFSSANRFGVNAVYT